MLSVIAESLADMDYWSDECCIGGKTVAKIRFGSFCVTKPLLNFLLIIAVSAFEAPFNPLGSR
jgi:hypothetical protein